MNLYNLSVYSFVFKDCVVCRQLKVVSAILPYRRLPLHSALLSSPFQISFASFFRMIFFRFVLSSRTKQYLFFFSSALAGLSTTVGAVERPLSTFRRAGLFGRRPSCILHVSFSICLSFGFSKQSDCACCPSLSRVYACELPLSDILRS